MSPVQRQSPRKGMRQAARLRALFPPIVPQKVLQGKSLQTVFQRIHNFRPEGDQQGPRGRWKKSLRVHNRGGRRAECFKFN